MTDDSILDAILTEWHLPDTPQMRKQVMGTFRYQMARAQAARRAAYEAVRDALQETFAPEPPSMS